MTNPKFDYIIVGAGSAGCVLANRLTESGKNSVLLLETGGSDNSLFIQMPTALSIPMNTTKYAWQYFTEPEPYLDNRVMHCPRGKVLGGSSSINGMVYVRGHAKDFDEWEEKGATGWRYANCLPYFKKAENWIDGPNAYRGGDGPLAVGLGNRMKNPLYRAFVEAGKQAGYPETEDYNGYQQEGFGPMQMTVKNGRRWSTSNAYLKPARSRPNLRIETGVQVTRIILDGKTVSAIEYEKNGKTEITGAAKEVILSAGAIGSPHLLQVSGIGDANRLKNVGITPIVDLPGVGENLQDHLEVYFQVACTKPITLNSRLNWFQKGLIGAQWLLARKGLGATNHFESCAFIRSGAGVAWPDIQYHFLPAAIRYDGKAAFSGHGFQFHVGHNKPASRGWVRAKSSNPKEHPTIQFNYLKEDTDIKAFRECIKLTREIVAQPAFEPYRGEEIQPGPAVQSDEEIDAYVRQAVESAYHPSGACRMGSDDHAVVDPTLRVHGVNGLRVVDSSVFPRITNGNLNAPTIMLAERAADLILGRDQLPADDTPMYDAPNWQQAQR